MRRTKINKAVTAAAVTAVVTGLALAGCRAFTQMRPAAGGGSGVEDAALVTASVAANANGAAVSGVEAVKVHTNIAQELVEKAIPQTTPVGQAQLSAAGMEHQAVISSADKTAASLEELREQFAQVSKLLAGARNELAAALENQRKLEHEWYVVWGLRIEKAFWTITTVWLLGSIASMVLGVGNPASWIASVRNLIAGSRQRWIGNAFVK